MEVARLRWPQLLPAAILSAGPVRPQGAQRLLADDGRHGTENQGHGDVALALAAADHRSTRGGLLPSAVRCLAEGSVLWKELLSKSEKLPLPNGAKASWRAEAGMPWTGYVSEDFHIDANCSGAFSDKETRK
jgi:hypothetical protein